MNIKYNSQLRIIRLATLSFSSLIFQKYFKYYQSILSNKLLDKESFTINALQNLGFNIQPNEFDLNTKYDNLNNEKLSTYIKDIKSTFLLLYKPVLKQNLYPGKIAGNTYNVSNQLENKYFFRKKFSNLINTPQTVFLPNCRETFTEKNYQELVIKLGLKFVLQNEISTGGKGTQIISSQAEWLNASQDFLSHYPLNSQLVISQYISGQSCSFNACLTKYGLFTMGEQQQLISHPLLTDIEDINQIQFCGGSINSSQNSPTITTQIEKIISQIEPEIKKINYKGYIGVDYMLDENKKVWPIEINARFTGLAGMIDLIQSKNHEIPFSLLSVLEFTDPEYEVTNLNDLKKYQENHHCGSLLVGWAKKDLQPAHEIKVGVYSYHENLDQFIYNRPLDLSLNIHSLNLGEIILLPIANANASTKKGKKIFELFSPEQIVNQNQICKYYTALEKLVGNFYQ